MTQRFLISVDIDNGNDIPQGSLDLKQVSFLGGAFINVHPSQVDAAVVFLKKHFGKFQIHCNATAFSNNHDLIALLDGGAAKVFVNHQQLKDIVQENLVEDLSRLVLSIDPSFCGKDPAITVKDVQAQLQDVVGDAKVDIHIPDVHDWKLLDMMHEYEKQPESYPKRFVTLSRNIQVEYDKAIKGGHLPIISSTALTVEPERFPDLVPASFLITTVLQTDRTDGLYTTIVIDEHQVCLGLVYSSQASIRAALKSGAGVYYSRSRKALWIKGATSGDTQELINIALDCDGDALRFTVRQKGTGKVDISYTRISRLKSCRILPFTNRNMFRSICGSLTLRANIAASQSVSTAEILHRTTIQRTAAATSKDYGRSR